MKVFIVYCHPSEDSFTKNMCDCFGWDNGKTWSLLICDKYRLESMDLFPKTYGLVL